VRFEVVYVPDAGPWDLLALGLAAVALISLARIENQYVALIPRIGVGIFWASAVGIPYLMVASMVPAKRTGSTWGS
jgi:maltose/moltooligosaccharide transporter